MQRALTSRNRKERLSFARTVPLIDGASSLLTVEGDLGPVE